MDIAPEVKALHEAVLTRVKLLMVNDPARDTPDGEELSLLADLAMFYEREIFPSTHPQASVLAMDIKQRLEIVRQDLGELGHLTHADTCRDGMARITALEKIVGDVHEAIGEDRHSDDDSLADTVRKIIADLKSTAA